MADIGAEDENANGTVPEHIAGKNEAEMLLTKKVIQVMAASLFAVALACLVAMIVLYANYDDNSSNSAETNETALDIIYLGALSTTIFLNLYGFGFVHKYGRTEDQFKVMEAANLALERVNAEIAQNASDLKTNVDRLRTQVDQEVANTQKKLQVVVADGNEILRIGKQIKSTNEETLQLFSDVEDIQKLAKQLQRQIMKNQLIKLFHELEMDDYEAGLTLPEYEDLIYRLDKETADAFREVASFKKIDENKNGVIERSEFEVALNKVIRRLTEKDKIAVTEMMEKEKRKLEEMKIAAEQKKATAQKEANDGEAGAVTNVEQK